DSLVVPEGVGGQAGLGRRALDGPGHRHASTVQLGVHSKSRILPGSSSDVPVVRQKALDLESAPRRRVGHAIEDHRPDGTGRAPGADPTMIDLAPPWDLVALAIALALSLGILRLLTGKEPVNLGAPFAFRAPEPWPRGVQEEEPAPWRLDL